MRESFEVIEYNFEIISALAKTGYEFAHIWTNYLKSSGWTEEEYESELASRVYSKSIN